MKKIGSLRVSLKKARGTMAPRYLIRCGCCKERVEIYFDDIDRGRIVPSMRENVPWLEINGVNGSVAEWKRVLLPLLEGKDIK